MACIIKQQIYKPIVSAGMLAKKFTKLFNPENIHQKCFFPILTQISWLLIS